MKGWLGLALALCFLCTASAQGPPCASDELLNSTTNTCYCDPSKYTIQVTPLDPSLQCLSGQMKLNMSKCQLEKSKFDSDNLHLLDQTCKGVRVVDGIALVAVSATTSSTACGNILSFSADGSSVIYSNNLTIPGKVSASGIISRQNYIYNFSCSYPLKNIPASLVTAIKPILGVVPINLTDGSGSVSVLMYAYVDSSFTTVYTESSPSLYVQDPIYISVNAPDLNGDTFSVRVNRLFVSASASATDLPQYDLVSNNGCPGSEHGDLVTINKNGDTNEARFTVSAFQISGSETLYFHAYVEICYGKCIPVCSSTSRSGASDGSGSPLTMGPIYAETAYFSAGSCDRFSWIWMVNFLMLSLLVQKLHK